MKTTRVEWEYSGSKVDRHIGNAIIIEMKYAWHSTALIAREVILGPKNGAVCTTNDRHHAIKTHHSKISRTVIIKISHTDWCHKTFGFT